jgi:uncharacterized protein with PhoU and TrkA domain
VQILAIERGGEFLPIPRGDDVLQPDDSLVVFGRARAIEQLFEPEDAEALGIVEAGGDLAPDAEVPGPVSAPS